MKKQIWGVNHSLDEVGATVKKLNECRPKKVGLEVTPTQLKIGMPNFFYQIGEYLENRNIEIFPLEDRSLRNMYYSVILARNVLHGKMDIKELNRNSGQFLIHYSYDIDGYKSPQTTNEWINGLMTHTTAVGILDAINNLEDLAKVWERTNILREQHMTEQARKYDLDLLIIGRGHGPQMAKYLHDYTYTDFDPDVPVEGFYKA
tara:strand:- start:44953 stop:45564 length:612 start_codon:yes stop_codon:yes gene_type:complete